MLDESRAVGAHRIPLVATIAIAVKDPLVGPLAAIAAGILVSRYVPFAQSELLWTIAAFFVLGIIAISRDARLIAGASCILGLFFAGILTSFAHTPGPPPELDAAAREVVTLGGCVIEPPAISGDRERFILELEPHARAQVTLYARENESLPLLRYGQRVDLDARVRQPRNYGNPGAFDYARYLARQQIYWTASGAAGSLHVLPGRCGNTVQKAVMNLRQAALARLASLYRGNDYNTGMMQAILIGQSFQLQRIWTEQYRSTGTFHAIVISGTHVAIIAAVFLFLLRICFIPEAPALLLTVLVTWLYALVTGWQAPCVRSAAGLTIFMVCGYFYRERRAMNLLAAVALGFLVLDPEQLFDASFQLTFLAVGFLCAFAHPLIAATSGPLVRGLRDFTDIALDLHLPPRVAQFRVELRLLAETLSLALRFPRRAATLAVTLPARLFLFVYELVAISAIAQMGLALPMVVYFHRVGFSGLSANAFVVPLLGLVIPVGFIAAATGWAWIAALGGALLHLSQIVVQWHASMEPNWRIPTPPVWLAIALSVAMIATALVRRWWRLAPGAATAALLTVLLWHPFPPQIQPGQLELTTIDVGQGDSLLVVFPDGKRMIVDGGGIPTFGRQRRAQLDIGEDVVAPYLWNRSIRRVDVVAATHAHEDHIGGLPALVQDFRPNELWTGVMGESSEWSALCERAARSHIKVVPLAANRRFPFGGAEIEVLAPPPDYTPSHTPTDNDCLVLRVRFGRRSFLLTSDLERRMERRLLSAESVTPSEILKVAHHGSKTSSAEDFVAGVKPLYAVISVGLDNSYGHPNREVLDRLEAHHAVIFRTDRDGLISIRTDGRRLYVDTHRWNAARPLLLGIF
jgi:competence protein ComEC